MSGHQKRKQRAKIVETVFQRSAGEQKAAAGAEGAQGLGILRAAVLDVLGLVSDHAGEFDGLEQRLIPHQRAVGGDHEVGRSERRRRIGTPLPVMGGDPQSRGKPGCFTPPVLDQRSGAYHETGAADWRVREA